MRVLITRSEPGASATADKVRERGARPIVTPILSIRFADEIDIDLKGVQALLFTSANGVRAWLAARSEMSLPAYCVGDATARAAHEAGFLHIHSAGGNAADLTDLCAAELEPEAGRLVHLRGQHSARDLASLLAARGFDAHEAVIYRADAANSLPLEAAVCLRRRDIGVVLLHSPRAAFAFTALVEDAGLTDTLSSVIGVVISEAAKEGLVASDWAAVRVAEEPTENAMLSRISIVP